MFGGRRMHLARHACRRSLSGRMITFRPDNSAPLVLYADRAPEAVSVAGDAVHKGREAARSNSTRLCCGLPDSQRWRRQSIVPCG
jgi:hypothetical protein